MTSPGRGGYRRYPNRGYPEVVAGPGANVKVTASTPRPDGNSYFVEVYNGTAGGVQVTVLATCAIVTS